MDYSVGWLGAFHQDLELKNIEKIRDWLQMTEMDLCSLHSGSSNNEWTKEMEDQWRVARKMLCEVISSAKGNGELGAIVVSFCLSLLHVLHSASPREAVLTACPSTGVLIFARNRRDITMEISQHITTLKSCGSVDSSPVGSVTVLLSQPTLKELWQRWLKMDVVEAVRSGLESQQMALITSFLTSKGLWKPTEVNETIQSIGKEWVQELLTEGRVEKSTSVLVNMGHEPVVYLKEVLLSTKQRSIRQLLHSHLSEHLSAQEERILTFIQKVDDAISNISQQHSNRDVPLEGFLTADQVLKYSEGEITAIALEIAHLTQECPLPDIKSLLSWQWLLSRNSLTQLLGWVECSLGGQKKGEVLNEWLNARGMTEDMVESVIDSPAMTCVKNRVLNRLCQYGIFSHNEDKDASLFLRRLLLSNFNLFAISDLRNTYMGNEYLHQLTLHHYAKLNLPCALVSHVDSFTEITLPILQDLQTDAPWVTLLQECVAAGDILQLALATLNHLNVGQTSYLSNKPHLAFAIAMLDKQNIKSLCTGDQQSNIQGVNLLESLSSIPLVKKALITTEVLQPAERTSIYSLLKGSLTFDLSRTLGWMDQKRGASESDIPHFSNPEIVDKYSHQEPLGFVFYLRQGRPSYAAVSLLVELWTKDKMFYKHRLREACNIAHGLAFGVYPSRRVLCACVAFIAMVGCPSQLLRSTIALADGCINKQISKEEQNRIVHRIRQLPLNSLESVSLLSCLERCIISSSPMTNVEDSSSCVSSIKDWSLCVHFAQEHHLTYPETMLVHCAREGQWIPFLIIAHVFQYPKEQIVNLLSHFKSSSLRSHLHCSLLHPIRFPSHQSNKERRDPLVANRDTRRSLYSKIGLHKEKQECDSTSSSPRQDDDFSPGSPTNLSTISSYSEEDKSIDNEMVSSHNDLFSVVYYCHSTPYPSQSLLSNAISLNNPTYAAIARLYQESCVISCLSTWLYCSLSPHHQLELSEIFKQPIKMLQWTKEEVGEIMELAFRRGYVATVKEAARMFLTQEHPLTSLLSFLYEAITSYEGDMALVHLKAFQAACYNFKYMPSRTEDTLDLHWVATTSVSLLYCTLCHCLKTPAYKERFCRLVLSVNFKDHLPMHKGSFADFSVLANLQSCLLETNIQIYFDFLLCGSRSVSFTVETQRLLQTALENRYFDAATKIAQIIGQSTDHIVIAQLSWEYLSEEESHFLELEVSRLSFWDRCNRRLRAEASMEGHKAAVFFKDHACYSRTRKERLHILSLSWNWINECGNNRETSSGTSSDGCKLLSDEDNSVASVEELMGQVEVELWQCRILDYIDGNRDVSSYVNPISQQGLCLVSHLIKPVHSSEILLTGAAEMTALEDIMGELLDMGDVATVYRLKEMFQHPCKSESTPTIDTFSSNKQVLEAEILWAMKVVSSHYSYRSCQDVSNLFPLMFSDSNIAKRFSCGETKCAYLCCFGIAPYFQSLVTQSMSDGDYILLFDESLNRKMQQKQLDFHVRFWDLERNKVRTRYLHSDFIGHSTAEDLLSSFTSLMQMFNLRYNNLIQISMDGPAVNWKFYDMVFEKLKTDTDSTLISTGSCGLHIVNGCFKSGSKATKWDIENVLSSVYYLLKDCPARRDDYFKVTKASMFPLKFCPVRWLENVPVSTRVLEMWPYLIVYVDAVAHKKVPDPKTKSFNTVKEATSDILMPVKIEIFLSIAKHIQPFLASYQSDHPMLPFISSDMMKILKGLMDRFVKAEVMKTITNVTTLLKVKFQDKENYLHQSKIYLGFSAEKQLKDLVAAKKVNERSSLQLRLECRDFLVEILSKLMVKCPLKYSVVRNMSCLDPREMKNRDNCVSKFKQLLRKLVECTRIPETSCDELLSEFTDFLDSNGEKHEFQNYDHRETHIDEFLYEHMGVMTSFVRLWKVIKTLLILSHGQASVERGFSCNRQIEVENLKQKTLVAQRVICEHLTNVDGVTNVLITRDMLASAAGARQKWMLHLEEQKRSDDRNNTKRKRTTVSDTIMDLKQKRARLDTDRLSFLKSADTLAEKAENTGNVTLIAKSNSMRRSAKEKEQQIKSLDDTIKAKTEELNRM